MSVEPEKDAEQGAGGAHDAVASSAVAAPKDDSGDDACDAAGPENMHAAQSAATVEELSGSEPGRPPRGQEGDQ
ncbi:hypothetical protein MRX96_018822 [Rhipicephalus microplus]